MERVERFLQMLHDKRISRDFDAIIPVIGDEGYGKSTLILECIGRYEDYRDRSTDPGAILDKVVWDDRDAFREHLRTAGTGDPIAAMDASHILYKKDTMMPDQKQTEKQLLDIRIKNYVIFLGYQDWGDIPDQLQRRRAKYVLRIPQRGVVYGYNRQSLDEKYDMRTGEGWPEPDLRDRFSSLEGTDLWEQFTELDESRKEHRLEEDDEDDEPAVTPQEVLSDILDRGDEGDYVDTNDVNNQTFVSKHLIRLDYPELSDQQAQQVKHGLRREVDLEAFAGEDAQPVDG